MRGTWRSSSLALAVAAGLGAWTWFLGWDGPLAGPYLRAAAGVLIGVAVATVVYGEASWLTVAVGALSPLAFALIERSSFALAAAAMCFAWLAPRFVLSGTRRRLVTLAVTSAFASGVAGSVLAAYSGAALGHHLAACVFAGSCASLPALLVPVETSAACALRAVAAVVEGPARGDLTRAAALHGSVARLGRARRERGPWRALVALADERASLEALRGVDTDRARRDLDGRIASLVASLETAPAGPAELAPLTGPAELAPPTGPAELAPPTQSAELAPPAAPSEPAVARAPSGAQGSPV